MICARCMVDKESSEFTPANFARKHPSQRICRLCDSEMFGVGVEVKTSLRQARRDALSVGRTMSRITYAKRAAEKDEIKRLLDARALRLGGH